MWLGIHTDGLVEHYFFDSTIMGQSYRELMLELYGLMQVDQALARIQRFILDDTLPHYMLIVREYLDRHFGDWIGRCGVVEWPAR